MPYTRASSLTQSSLLAPALLLGGKNKYVEAYKITSAGDRVIEVSLGKNPDTDNLDTYLYIFREDGNLYDKNDDDGDGNDCFEAGGEEYCENSYLEIDEAGTFYILASTYGEEATGTYAIRVREYSPPQPEIVINGYDSYYYNSATNTITIFKEKLDNYGQINPLNIYVRTNEDCSDVNVTGANDNAQLYDGVGCYYYLGIYQGLEAGEYNLTITAGSLIKNITLHVVDVAVEITPEVAAVQYGTQQLFRATPKIIPANANVEADYDVYWRINSSVYSTDISANGLLTVDENETAEEIQVCAEFYFYNSYSYKENCIDIELTDEAVAPTIAFAPGTETSKTLTEGYNATSTGVLEFDITGTSPYFVFDTEEESVFEFISTNEKITWDNAAKKINIAAGLTANESSVKNYVVKFKVSNIAGEDEIEFTIKVNPRQVTPPNNGNEPIIVSNVKANSMQAFIQNGALRLTGLASGKSLSIYGATGKMIHQGIATGSEATFSLNAKGIYFVKNGTQSLKVVNR